MTGVQTFALPISYRAGKPADEVRQFIREGRGVAFDPEIADLFLSMEW